MTTCLVLGGNGFIGSHLSERLVSNGYHVKVLDGFLTGRQNLEFIKDKIEIIDGNFLDETILRMAMKNADYVFHYISTTIPASAKKDPVYDIQTNIIGSVKVFQLAVENKIKKIIFSSSGGTIYGEPAFLPIRETFPTDPIDPYGISKLTIEKYLHYFFLSAGLDYLILRYSNPYGERQNPFGQQGVIPIFLNQVKTGKQPVIYGDGSMIRDYIYITDAISATLAVFESNTNEKVFNIGSGDGRSLNELISIMSKVTGKVITPKYISVNGNYIQKMVLDSSKVQKLTGWKSNISLEEGIKKTWDWILKRS
jgi:UDP-glucose 4-epimerase